MWGVTVPGPSMLLLHWRYGCYNCCTRDTVLRGIVRPRFHKEVKREISEVVL